MLTPYLKVLKNRDFFFLWLAQVISQFGDRLTQIALVGLVYAKVGASSLSLAKVMFFTILPVFLISPLAGVYVDRWDRRKTMYVSDFLRGLLILVLALFGLGFKSFIPLYTLIFLTFCIGRFFIPAKMSIIPYLIEKKEDLFIANSLVSLTANVAAILGFGIGGLIVERWGSFCGFVIDSITFFLSSLLIIFIGTQTQGRFKKEDFLEIGKDLIKVEKSLLGEFKEGLNYLLSKESTLFSIKSFSFLFSCLGALYVVFIVFIQETLHTATKDLGFLAVGLGLGLFFGSLIYGRIASKFSLTKTINLMFFLSNIFLLIFVVSLRVFPSRSLVSLFSFILGGLVSPIVIGVNSLIHKKSQGNFWGRIFSSLEVVMHLSFLVFMFITSYLAEVYSAFSIILLVGIIGCLLSALSLFKKEVCLD